MRISVTYAGVQKERMVTEDMYVLSSDGFILLAPVLKAYPHMPPKCTDCAPLFVKVKFSSGDFLFSLLSLLSMQCNVFVLFCNWKNPILFFNIIVTVREIVFLALMLLQLLMLPLVRKSITQNNVAISTCYGLF